MKSNIAPASGIQTATGPRTVEGKRRSSRNAIKHGIFSKHLFLDPECREDFDKLHQGLREDLHPEGAIEQLLVEQLAITFLRYRLVILVERAMMARSPAFVLESINGQMDRLKQVLKEVESENPAFDLPFSPRPAPPSLLPPQSDLDLVVRYDRHLSRELDRILSRLETVQRARRGHPPTPTIKINVD
jgi:hypothetical protein